MKYACLLAVIGVVFSTALPGRVSSNESDSVSARTAAELYSKKCASCHGKDGRARTFKAKFNHARDLTDSAWQADVSDERMFNSIMNGKRKMPSFGKRFSEPEINSLVAYVRALKKSQQ